MLFDLYGLVPSRYANYSLFTFDGESGGGEGGASGSTDDDDDDDGGTPPDPTKTYTHAELEAILKRRLTRQEKKITKTVSATVEQQVKDKLEAERIAKDGTLQEKLDAANKELADVPTMKQMLTVLADTAEKRYKRTLDALPETIRLLAPDDDIDILTREKWLEEKGLPAAEKLKGEGGTGTTGTTGPKGNTGTLPEPGKPSDEEKVKGLVKKFRASGIYRPM
jgi:hypothetical protein